MIALKLLNVFTILMLFVLVNLVMCWLLYGALNAPLTRAIADWIRAFFAAEKPKRKNDEDYL